MDRLEALARLVAERRMHPPNDPEVEKEAPFLWEMLTSDKWGDGSERILPTIRIERVPGAYRVSLVDDSLCIRKTVLVSQLDGFWKHLDRCLNDDEVPWEGFKSYKNKKGPPIPAEKPTRRKRS